MEDDVDLAKIYTEALKIVGFEVETLLDGQCHRFGVDASILHDVAGQVQSQKGLTEVS